MSSEVRQTFYPISSRALSVVHLDVIDSSSVVSMDPETSSLRSDYIFHFSLCGGCVLWRRYKKIYTYRSLFCFQVLRRITNKSLRVSILHLVALSFQFVCDSYLPFWKFHSYAQ